MGAVEWGRATQDRTSASVAPACNAAYGFPSQSCFALAGWAGDLLTPSREVLRYCSSAADTLSASKLPMAPVFILSSLLADFTAASARSLDYGKRADAARISASHLLMNAHKSSLTRLVSGADIGRRRLNWHAETPDISKSFLRLIEVPACMES